MDEISPEPICNINCSSDNDQMISCITIREVMMGRRQARIGNILILKLPLKSKRLYITTGPHWPCAIITLAMMTAGTILISIVFCNNPLVPWLHSILLFLSLCTGWLSSLATMLADPGIILPNTVDVQDILPQSFVLDTVFYSIFKNKRYLSSTNVINQSDEVTSIHHVRDSSSPPQRALQLSNYGSQDTPSRGEDSETVSLTNPQLHAQRKSTFVNNDSTVFVEVKSQPLNNRFARFKHCNVCGVTRFQSGTHHCSECGVCVTGFDHHCPWTSKCIGSKTRVYFYIWIFFILISIIYSFGIFAVYVNPVPRKDGSSISIFADHSKGKPYRNILTMPLRKQY